ncbi:MAG: thiamine pyrophosphate-binding protein [Gammaproteobacteria bacterium]|nr:thiamine pyrophosphate-binding protein [Gammaproteobacteria bacterium]
MNGSEILARALKRQGADTFFYIMGGPMMAAETSSMKEGLRGVDVRHEQAAAMMAHAYARLRNRPGICMAASGPATTNLLTGVAHAWADGVPIIAFGGASPVSSWGTGAFQEMDQLTCFEPCTKWSARAHHPSKVPELVVKAFQQAMSGKPGPVYIDMPGDVLYHDIDEAKIDWPEPWDIAKRSRPAADAAAVQALVDMLAEARQPVIISGSGVLWSEASAEYQAFVEQTGIPFYTTPQSRGAIPEDHDYCYLTARSTAFREADLIIVLGTRMNYVIGHAAPPRFNADAKIVRIDIDPSELDSSPRALDLPIAGDVRTVLSQVMEASRGRITPETYASWRERLRGRNQSKTEEQEQIISSNDTPIHPLRLCKEVRDFMSRDDVLVVDGQEILNYGRQSIPTFKPAHRMNSGVFGTMGVGMPFGVGAKVAKPDSRVIVLHGDGSFGMNAMEIDTSVRHNAPVLIVISLNGGWTGDPDKEKPGRDLGYTRYDKMAEGLGAHGEFVERPEDIRPALERAAARVDAGQTALVNVVTDWRARATTAAFTRYAT